MTVWLWLAVHTVVIHQSAPSPLSPARPKAQGPKPQTIPRLLASRRFGRFLLPIVQNTRRPIGQPPLAYFFGPAREPPPCGRAKSHGSFDMTRTAGMLLVVLFSLTSTYTARAQAHGSPQSRRSRLRSSNHSLLCVHPPEPALYQTARTQGAEPESTCVAPFFLSALPRGISSCPK